MSLGALPTGFTPASSCLAETAIWQIHTVVQDTGETMVYDQFGPPPTSDCMPPAFNPASTAFYSPGRCPTGYSVASQGTKAIGSATETTQVCCPSVSGMDFTTQTTGITQGHSFLSTLLCYHAYTGTGTLDATVTSLGGEEPGSTTIQYEESRGAINAYGFVVRFQSEDFESKTSSRSSSPASNLSTPTPTSGASSASPTPTEAAKSGLSTAASVGIGVGVGIVVLGLILGAAWLFLSRRRKAKMQTEQQAPYPGWYPPPQEMDSQREAKMLYAYEAPQEMSGRDHMDPQELAGDQAYGSNVPSTRGSHVDSHDGNPVQYK